MGLFFNRPINATDFEESAFKVVMKNITDKRAFAEELAGIENLRRVPVVETEKRQKLAAELYLLLERNISEEQSRNRISPEALRERVSRECHPERAAGNFALFFLPHYERQIKMFEHFTDMVFQNTKDFLGTNEYTALLKDLMTDPVSNAFIGPNGIDWKRIAKQIKHAAPAVRRDTVRSLLQRMFRMLTKKLTEDIGELRTEVMLQNVYHRFHNATDFIEDSPRVLLLVPDTFLPDERIALMGKEELQEKLREKSVALETTLAEVEGEKLKLSTLSREELEKKVQERTAELVTALKSAQEARQNLEEFSSLATHELRTPIAAIRGYVKLLLGGKADRFTAEQKKFLEQVEHADERLLMLVNSMLDISRVELGTLAIEPTATYIPNLADGILADLAPKIKEKKQVVVNNYDRVVPIVNVDPSLVHAILENLLSNAVKYTPDGGTITLDMKKVASNMLITVKDTGYGIPQNQQAKIFEKLFRADNVRAKEIEGTGLGLYLIKRILEETGGTIRFESEENKGTTFFVTIPLAGMQRREGTKGLS